MKRVPIILLLLLCSGCDRQESLRAQQALIDAFRWGQVVIKKADGTVEETTNGEDWLFAPTVCQKWNYKTFGKGPNNQTITHLWPNKPRHQQGTGVLPYAVDGLRQLADKLDVIIVSTGVEGALGIHDATSRYLAFLKKQGTIQAYYILRSEAAYQKYNACVRAGQAVGCLLHTTC